LEQVLAMSHSSLFDQTYVGVPQNARISEGLVGSALADDDRAQSQRWTRTLTTGFPATSSTRVFLISPTR